MYIAALFCFPFTRNINFNQQYLIDHAYFSVNPKLYVFSPSFLVWRYSSYVCPVVNATEFLTVANGAIRTKFSVWIIVNVLSIFGLKSPNHSCNRIHWVGNTWALYKQCSIQMILKSKFVELTEWAYHCYSNMRNKMIHITGINLSNPHNIHFSSSDCQSDLEIMRFPFSNGLLCPSEEFNEA